MVVTVRLASVASLLAMLASCSAAPLSVSVMDCRGVAGVDSSAPFAVAGVRLDNDTTVCILSTMPRMSVELEQVATRTFRIRWGGDDWWWGLDVEVRDDGGLLLRGESPLELAVPELRPAFETAFRDVTLHLDGRYDSCISTSSSLGLHGQRRSTIEGRGVRLDAAR